MITPLRKHHRQQLAKANCPLSGEPIRRGGVASIGQGLPATLPSSEEWPRASFPTVGRAGVFNNDRGREMTWMRGLALSAVLVLLPTGTQVAYAQGYPGCMTNAADIRRDCLRGLGAPAHLCNRNYRDDVAECHRYDWRRRPIHPIRHPPPPTYRPPPPSRPGTMPVPGPRPGPTPGPARPGPTPQPGAPGTLPVPGPR